MDNWVYIYSDEHGEGGSERVSAFTDEAEFIAFVKKSVSDCVDDLPACIEEAKRSSGDSVFVHKGLGWGGEHIFVVPNGISQTNEEQDSAP